MQIGQSHPTGLTANLLKLFEPRPPLEFKPPPEKRKCPPYTGKWSFEIFFGLIFPFNSFFLCGYHIYFLALLGMAQFVSQFAEPDDPEYAPPVQKAETPVRNTSLLKLIVMKGGIRFVSYMIFCEFWSL